MVKLKRLKILKYRNIKPGTELHFDDGINLILGQNASGKTTLLSLVSAVCRGDFRNLDENDFEIQAEIASPTCNVTMEVAHRRQAKLWNATFTARHAEDEDDVRKLDAVPSGWGDPDLARFPPSTTELLSVSQTYRFDESLDAFLAATGRSAAVESPATPPPTCVEEEFDAEDSFLVTFNYCPVNGGDSAQTVSAADDNLCRALAEGLGVLDVTMRPEIREEGTHGYHHYYRTEGFSFFITRHDGNKIHHDRLSYGQKRLLAFFYYLACNPSVVIADELVNGLHHRWIDACMKALGDRQAFLTSQNPLLFDYVEFDSVEQVQSRFITCKLERQDDGRELMVWQNMPREDAETFFNAYQAGIEHVGDILITRGMW